MGNNQDILGSITNLFSNSEQVIWTAVGLIVAFLLLKWITKANTFSTAALAVLAVALLSWLVGAVRDDTFNDQIGNTWNNSSSTGQSSRG